MSFWTDNVVGTLSMCTCKLGVPCANTLHLNLPLNLVKYFYTCLYCICTFEPHLKRETKQLSQFLPLHQYRLQLRYVLIEKFIQNISWRISSSLKKGRNPPQNSETEKDRLFCKHIFPCCNMWNSYSCQKTRLHSVGWTSNIQKLWVRPFKIIKFLT